MKKFILRLIVFVITLYVFAIGVDFVISKGLRESGIRKYVVWTEIINSRASSDILILGSSRAWCQYDTKIIEDTLMHTAYNLGIDGHPIDYQLIRYGFYRKYNDKPKYIIQNIDFSTIDIRDDGYEREQFFPFINEHFLVNQIKVDKNISLIDRFIPLVRYYGYRDNIQNGIMSFIGKKDFDDSGLYKGFRSNDLIWNESNLFEIDSIKFSYNNKPLIMFEEYLKQAKKENIEVILVSAPIHNKVLEKIQNANELNSFFLSIAKKYDLKLFDYKYDEMCQDTLNFYNGTHLNKRGAEMFTKKLVKDLKEIIE